MKRRILFPLAAMMMLAANDYDNVYAENRSYAKNKTKPTLKNPRKRYEDMSEEEKVQYDAKKRLFEAAEDKKRHTFNVNGTLIRALSKKDAKRKYARLYGKKK